MLNLELKNDFEYLFLKKHKKFFFNQFISISSLFISRCVCVEKKKKRSSVLSHHKALQSTTIAEQRLPMQQKACPSCPLSPCIPAHVSSHSIFSLEKPKAADNERGMNKTRVRKNITDKKNRDQE